MDLDRNREASNGLFFTPLTIRLTLLETIERIKSKLSLRTLELPKMDYECSKAFRVVSVATVVQIAKIEIILRTHDTRNLPANYHQALTYPAPAFVTVAGCSGGAGGVVALGVLVAFQSRLIYFPGPCDGDEAGDWKDRARRKVVDSEISQGKEWAFLKMELKSPRNLWIRCRGNGTVAPDGLTTS